MIGIFKIILLFIKYGPIIWRIVSEILEFIKGATQYMTETDAKLFTEAKMGRLKKAVAYYSVMDSTAMLEELHGELNVQLMNLKDRHK